MARLALLALLALLACAAPAAAAESYGPMPGTSAAAGPAKYDRVFVQRIGPRRAQDRARTVILGGHSLAASTAVAHASWDFRRRPGFRHVDGSR